MGWVISGDTVLMGILPMIILLSTEILFQPVDILNYKRENKKQNNDITLNEYTVKVFKLPVYKQYKDDLL